MKKKFLIVLLFTSVLVLGFGLGKLHFPDRGATAHSVLYYVDPMHPSYRSNKPGKAPDCGMALVPVYSDDAAKAAVQTSGSSNGDLHIDPAAQQLCGIRLAKVEKSSGQNTLRVFGKVAVDETRVYRINLGTDGYVKETHDDAVGNIVKKNQHLGSVYSPDFLAVTGGYLSANERTPGTGAKDAAMNQNTASAQARADRLRNLGMSDVQIDEVAATKRIPEDIYLVSPVDGFILSRNLSPGLRFERQTDLYTIGDLSHIWIIAQIFGSDANSFKPGTTVRVTLPDTNESFKAKVSNVLPEVDPVSHTMKLRLEADNPGYKLRPEMFVNVELPVSLPAGLSVPADAVVDSGQTKRVFVQTSEGNFVPREVQTGWRIQDRVQIISGLKEGDTIASAGTFLIDSESRLQLAANSEKQPSNSTKNDIAMDANSPQSERHHD